jgi:hypothetical protein
MSGSLAPVAVNCRDLLRDKPKVIDATVRPVGAAIDDDDAIFGDHSATPCNHHIIVRAKHSITAALNTGRKITRHPTACGHVIDSCVGRLLPPRCDRYRPEFPRH